MTWEVEYTDQFGEWWDSLGEEEQDAVTAAVNVLQRGGPSLGRPLVDTIKQSRHKNMKELIPPASRYPRPLRVRPAPRRDPADRRR